LISQSRGLGDVYKRQAKATIGATLHFAVASVAALSNAKFEDDFNVNFYPNPTNDTLNVSLGSLPESDYTFSLLDINGKEIVNIPIKNAKLIESISVTTLAKGIYLGVLKTSNKRVTKKVVIE
jgi:aminopeptidase YwaD